MAETTPIKFPIPKPREQALRLTLRRRRPAASERTSYDVLDAAAAARQSINEIVAAARGPLNESPDAEKLIELERALRQLEVTLTERQRAVEETESRLVDRERDVAEMEALLVARENLAELSHKPSTANVSEEEKAALEELRMELERQEATLLESKKFLREREQFLEESEVKLFEKVQAQQDKENELEQREEDLIARLRRVREREAAIDPKAAEQLRVDDEAAKKRNEFAE
jgi:hypothetical protein